jgi:hypothetical protein
MNKITNKVLLKLNISLFIVMGVIFFTNLVHILDLYIDVKKKHKKRRYHRQAFRGACSMRSSQSTNSANFTNQF